MVISCSPLENMAQELEKSGDYLVLRRIRPLSYLVPRDGSQVKRGIFLDIETTGLDLLSCEPIEIALIPFEYREDGGIVEIHDALHQMNEPQNPISEEITKVTGITNEMVSGKSLDIASLEHMIEDAVVIIAHNAAFDRPIAERISEKFKEKAWACSMQDLDWKSHGFLSRKLGDILFNYHVFFEAHRATDDCLAGISMLAQKLPNSEKHVLTEILENARISSFRVFAEEAPFEAKDILRSRGYRWNTLKEFGPRAWWADISEGLIDQELSFLRERVYGYPISLPQKKITAFNRYSLRV